MNLNYQISQDVAKKVDDYLLGTNRARLHKIEDIKARLYRLGDYIVESDAVNENQLQTTLGEILAVVTNLSIMP